MRTSLGDCENEALRQSNIGPAKDGGAHETPGEGFVLSSLLYCMHCLLAFLLYGFVWSAEQGLATHFRRCK